METGLKQRKVVESRKDDRRKRIRLPRSHSDIWIGECVIGSILIQCDSKRVLSFRKPHVSYNLKLLCDFNTLVVRRAESPSVFSVGIQKANGKCWEHLKGNWLQLGIKNLHVWIWLSFSSIDSIGNKNLLNYIFIISKGVVFCLKI